jgi:eukaryotic-like serine/threonine-protein kinase
LVGIGSVVNGKYRLARLLGDGGMGSVFEAHHTALGTRVAIKVLHPELARRTGLVERFLQEARVAAQIRSPHVVQVTDIDRTPEGQAYIVMELLEGEPLSSVLDRQHKLPVTTACEYALQILAALEAAHALGVIHRDLKPENVFLTFAGGKPVLKLIDFGIAKARRSDPQQKNLTVAGAVMGTAEYMSPEQARSADKVDARADLYAAGVMLYEMIAGSRPVSGDDARIIALKVERGEVVPLVQAAPGVPREIAGLVHRAMAARPELRFTTATEMRLALERAMRAGTAAMGATAGAERAPGAGTQNVLAHASTKSDAAPWSSDGAAAVRSRLEDAPLARPGSGRDVQDTQSPAVHTLRAPPIASAMIPAAYSGAAVPPAPQGGGGPSPHRRGGRGRIVALVALPLLLGAGVVGVLVATGTWASSTTPPEPASSAGSVDEGEVEAAPGTAATPIAKTSDVPKLVPTRPISPAIPPPHPPPSGRPPAPAVAEAGAAPSPFLLPAALPPFPSVLPFPTTFPTAFPSTFPSVLPAWPPPLQPAPSAAPSTNGPGY